MQDAGWCAGGGGRPWPQHLQLRKHAYAHTGVKAYACTHPGCAYSFNTPNKLKRHALTHSGTAVARRPCVVCGWVYVPLIVPTLPGPRPHTTHAAGTDVPRYLCARPGCSTGFSTWCASQKQRSAAASDSPVPPRSSRSPAARPRAPGIPWLPCPAPLACPPSHSQEGPHRARQDRARPRDVHLCRVRADVFQSRLVEIAHGHARSQPAHPAVSARRLLESLHHGQRAVVSRPRQAPCPPAL